MMLYVPVSGASAAPASRPWYAIVPVEATVGATPQWDAQVEITSS